MRDEYRIITGHQPVYLPWLGLIHKISLADVFIYMNDVQYLTKDWNNRNKIKVGTDKTIWLTVPVDLQNSKSNLVKDILISEAKVPQKKHWQYKHWESIRHVYGKAPFFHEYKDFFEWLYLSKSWKYLAELNLVILRKLFEWFDLKAKIVIASEENFTQRKSNLVLEHALRFKAQKVVCGIHGKDYIVQDDFLEKGIDVIFQEYNHPEYKQRFNGFIPYLSCIDLLFHYGKQSRDICLSNNINREELCAQCLPVTQA
jgi:hypothetical protein